VGALLTGMRDFLRSSVGEYIRLELDIQPEPAVCLVDSIQLQQVLLNLAINARDAMPDGGRLQIALSRAEVVTDDSSSQAPGDYVRIEVTDTGPGIPEEQLMHVFEPFFTTKDPGVGSGLGLSMVYGFVNQSGGRVRVANQDGAGARVEILLPAAAPASDQRPTEQPFSADLDAARLLVVEDDPALSRLVSHSLRDLGYQVAAVSTGLQAIDFVDRHPDLDLVICDVVLPGVHSGLDVARHLTRTGHRARILLMSGYAEGEIERSRPLQAEVPVLHKPFHRRQLAERVAAVLSRVPPADARRIG
jgi:CheY-like chemotaxis protein